MMLLIIGAAFTGYALVGSQMRFWAVMVITRLLGVVPFVGEKLLFFFWGGYMLNWTTFQVLSVIQFVLPFMVVFIIVLQLLSLHLRGRTDLIGVQFDMEKVGFYPYFWCKDIVNLFIYFLIVFFMLVSPYSLGEPELFEESNPISSPLHIIPEWYFLPQYAILRCVPSKGLGVILILISVVTFLFYPFTYKFYSYTVARLSLVYRELLLVWFFWLGVIGSTPIAQPYMLTTQLIVFIYFMLQLLFFVSIFDVNYGFSLSDIL